MNHFEVCQHISKYVNIVIMIKVCEHCYNEVTSNLDDVKILHVAIPIIINVLCFK